MLRDLTKRSSYAKAHFLEQNLQYEISVKNYKLFSRKFNPKHVSKLNAKRNVISTKLSSKAEKTEAFQN